jgi:uncharacterized protein (DUF3084 family)
MGQIERMIKQFSLEIGQREAQIERQRRMIEVLEHENKRLEQRNVELTMRQKAG